MVESKYPKAYSKHIQADFRAEEIQRYKAENFKVIGLLSELAARKTELVDKTPFDNFENNVTLQIIEDRLNEIYALIKTNPELTQKYVEEAIEPVEGSLAELHNKVD